MWDATGGVASIGGAGGVSGTGTGNAQPLQFMEKFRKVLPLQVAR